MSSPIESKPAVPPPRRCEGTSAHTDQPCTEPATTSRAMNPSEPGGTILHYCDRCAADWDRQRALINDLL